MLTAADFHPGHFARGGQVEPGVFDWPHVDLAREVRAFIACPYDIQIVTDVDWMTWLEEGGRRLYDEPGQLSRATLEQCRMLLIAHVRNDRFVDGHLLSVLHDGHLVQVLHRVGELVE